MVDVCEAVTIDGGVLVGHDGSTGAQEALAWAAGLAVRTGLALHVLRAWSLVTAPRPPSWEPGYVPPLADSERAVRDDLERCVGAAGPDPVARVHTHVVHGAAVRALLHTAGGADLLVVGARGHGGFAGLLLGSTSDQCLRHAPCPVTVVRTGTGRTATWTRDPRRPAGGTTPA